ncbi:uncharacterized protein LOC110818991 [Carica papaya]|uniref:uncharacterized protein LOC110818991 n=1 Tax=Carica papaya TaxID=3649 RepID=UPI000B8CED41|nr:uncharacterized protein LOC110818991 [Carica papaya]
MALRINLFPSNTLPQTPKLYAYPTPTIARPKSQIQCGTNNIDISDAELASDLATEVAKLNSHLVQKEEAMKKSKELLFDQFCQFLDLKEEEVKNKWRTKMSEEEKWVVVNGFVSEWSVNFHPLSARSVRAMIEEYLHEGKASPQPSPSILFRGLRRIMGFSQNK